MMQMNTTARVVTAWDHRGKTTATATLQVSRVMTGDNPSKCRGYVIGRDQGQDWGEAHVTRSWTGVLEPGEIAIRQISLDDGEWERISKLCYKAWMASDRW
jgi:hypothetical protein